MRNKRKRPEKKLPNKFRLFVHNSAICAMLCCIGGSLAAYRLEEEYLALHYLGWAAACMIVAVFTHER